jgi:hypothetical protein
MSRIAFENAETVEISSPLSHRSNAHLTLILDEHAAVKSPSLWLIKNGAKLGFT